MSELQDLYQEVILDHNRTPRNFGSLEGPHREADGHNPLCGDRLRVFLRVTGDQIEALRFVGSGCAISKASASLMTDALTGRSTADAMRLVETFTAMITSAPDTPVPDGIGKLAALAGVREFPVRVKCATLAWHTFKAALDASSEAAGEVTTE